jgi:Tfp pilus assembly protein PilN
MRNPFQSHGTGTSSFLPEDYIAKQHDRRTNIIGLTLFFIVITGVLAAFFVTNQRWSTVKEQQEAINARYQQAAKEIEQLKRLEEQKAEMLARATLTASLKERAPRSILLAELLNRMPKNVALQEVTLEAKKVTPRRAPQKQTTARTRSLAKNAKAEAEEDATPQPPMYRTELGLVGVATTHNNVAAYVSALQTCPLLRGVELRFSETVLQDDRTLNKFRIEAMLDQSADAQAIEPLTLAEARRLGIGIDLSERTGDEPRIADGDEALDDELEER